MADAASFQWLCEELEAKTTLTRLEARGTVRLSLKTAGLDSGSVTCEQMRVILTRVLPDELTSRGVEDAKSLCLELAGQVPAEAPGDNETPEAIFARLGGS